MFMFRVHAHTPAAPRRDGCSETMYMMGSQRCFHYLLLTRLITTQHLPRVRATVHFLCVVRVQHTLRTSRWAGDPDAFFLLRVVEARFVVRILWRLVQANDAEAAT